MFQINLDKVRNVSVQLQEFDHEFNLQKKRQQSGTFYGAKFVKTQNTNMYLSFTKNSDSHLYPYKYVGIVMSIS